jgi:hypothetical protein
MAHQQDPIYFIESFIIIWVDAKLHDKDNFDDDTQHSIAALHHIANSIQLFDTSETCIDFIKHKIKEEKIFLIVSGSLGEHLVLQIEHDIKLDSIYIFCWDKVKHEQWTNRDHHHKIIGVFTDIREICDQLKEDIKHCQHESTSIQTLSSQTLKVVNHLDASFMYSQLFKEILLSMEHNGTEAKDKFVDFCRIHYAENSAELCVIEEFKESYSNASPIWWYTRECFMYSMLNRALGVQDVEILIKMSFFICDLHRQLEQFHKTMNHCQVLTVYRGQG